jgi:single-stranded-DNA-specific exonuclease
VCSSDLAVHRVAAEGLLLRGGGHRMAAGLTVARGSLDPAMARLAELLARQGAGTMGPADLRLDGLMMPGAATPALIEEIEKAGPFGQGAPAPRFAFAAMAVQAPRRIGETHLRFALADETGARLDAVAFGAFDGPLGPLVLNHDGARLHLAGRVEIDRWQGRTRVQLRLEDAARA